MPVEMDYGPKFIRKVEKPTIKLPLNQGGVLGFVASTRTNNNTVLTSYRYDSEVKTK